MTSNIEFVDIGFSNNVAANKILTISNPSSSPIKREIQHAKESHKYLDLTEGKKTRSIITLSSANGIVIVASAVKTSTIIERINKARRGREIVEKADNDIIKTSSK